MNSPVADVFAFKTCCGLRVFDANLEILVENLSSRRVVVKSSFDLMGSYGKRRIGNVLPPGDLSIEPGEVKGLYCFMDEGLWLASDRLILFDSDGRPFTATIHHKPPLSPVAVVNPDQE